MKFNEINQVMWEESHMYFDTCVIPVAGLTGEESPPETVACLAKLRDLLDWIEIPFKGRTVTYPAIQYRFSVSFEENIKELVHRTRSSHYKYVVIVSVNSELNKQNTGADLVISPTFGTRTEAAAALTECWKKDVSNL